MYLKLEAIGLHISSLVCQMSAFGCLQLVVISFMVVTMEATTTVNFTVATQTIMDTTSLSSASTRGRTTDYNLFTTQTQTVLASTLPTTNNPKLPSTLRTTQSTSPSTLRTTPSTSPSDRTSIMHSTSSSSEMMGLSTTAINTASLSSANVTSSSTPMEMFGSTTSLTPTQMEPVTALSITTEDRGTTETNFTSSSVVTVATTTNTVSDTLSIIEWFLVAVAVAAFIFFLYILYHFCQVRKRRRARTFSEQNKNIIEYATPQSPKEKWRNSWALEAMIYHIELPQETSAEMEARDNTVFEEDERDGTANSNHAKPHLTKL